MPLILILLLLAAPGALSACQQEKPLENVFTLELSFGDDDAALPEEYLLAQPMQLAVDAGGLMYVFDEQRIKIYSPDGQPVAIVGGPGQGPGEFAQRFGMRAVTVSDEGFIAAGSTNSRYYMNVYSPGREFIGRYHRDKFKARMYSGNGNESTIYVFGEDTYLGVEAEPREEDGYIISCENLVYYTPDSPVLLASYEKPVGVSIGSRSQTINGGGSFSFASCGGLIVYTHTRQEAFERDGKYCFRMHVYDRKTGERDSFEDEFDPMLYTFDDFDDYVDSLPEDVRGHLNSEFSRNVYYKEQDLHKKYRFREPLGRITLDGTFLFAGISRNYEEPALYCVYDLRTKERVSSFLEAERRYFPAIRNGYAYRIKHEEDAFPVVEKYRIDPAVYGK